MGTNSTTGDGWHSLHPARRPPSRSTPHHHTPPAGRAGRPTEFVRLSPTPRLLPAPPWRHAHARARRLARHAGNRARCWCVQVAGSYGSSDPRPFPVAAAERGKKKVLFSVQSCRLPPPPRRRRLRPRTACHHPWSGVGVLPVCRTHRRNTYVYVCCPSVTVDVSVSHHSLGTEEYTLFSFFRKKKRENY